MKREYAVDERRATSAQAAVVKARLALGLPCERCTHRRATTISGATGTRLCADCATTQRLDRQIRQQREARERMRGR
jgi:hypothetical protein